MKKILTIGFCSADSKSLYIELKQLFKVEVISLASFEDLKSHLKLNPVPNLILINRILNESKKPGLEVLKYLRENNQGLKAAILTGFERDQKESLNQGAALSFDLDLLISHLGPVRKRQRDNVINSINLILNANS